MQQRAHGVYYPDASRPYRTSAMAHRIGCSGLNFADGLGRANGRLRAQPCPCGRSNLAPIRYLYLNRRKRGGAGEAGRIASQGTVRGAAEESAPQAVSNAAHPKRGSPLCYGRARSATRVGQTVVTRGAAAPADNSRRWARRLLGSNGVDAQDAGIDAG
jgi:hypothetical protein